MLVSQFELFDLSDKAGCQTKNLLIRVVDQAVVPQACNAPSLSRAAE